MYCKCRKCISRTKTNLKRAYTLDQIEHRMRTSKKNTMLEVDKILEKCGDFGLMQVLMLLLFSLINVLSAMHYYSQTIISFVPKYWYVWEHDCNCCVYLMNHTTHSSHRCADGLEPASETPQTSSCLPQSYNETNIGECKNYNYELFMDYESFTSDMNWICVDAWKLTLGQSMFFVGSVVGTLCLGYLADILGRVPILIVANLIAMFGNLLTIFGTNLVLFSIFRLVAGFATDSNFLMMYILGKYPNQRCKKEDNKTIAWQLWNICDPHYVLLD